MSIAEVIRKYEAISQEIDYKHSYEEYVKAKQEFLLALKSIAEDEATREILAKLDELSHDPPREDPYYWILAAQFHPSHDYVPALTQILGQEIETFWNEGIIHILCHVPDERAIPALSKAIDFVTISDESRELAKLAMEALMTINTAEARSIVAERVNDNDEFVSEFAAEMVEYMNKHPIDKE